MPKITKWDTEVSLPQTTIQVGKSHSTLYEMKGPTNLCWPRLQSYYLAVISDHNVPSSVLKYSLVSAEKEDREY